MALIPNIPLEQRTQDVKISEDVTFGTMLLRERTLKGLNNFGFCRPSPIQLRGIPLGKCGFDLLLEAKSGTGKTAVFTIIILEKLDLNNGLQAIILAPTREIAAQICDVIRQIGSQYEGLVVEVVMGGLPVQDDIEKLKKPVHIIVGSPGRLKHLIQKNHIDVSSVSLLVLDECDKLMEKSFLPDVNYIFSVLPTQKQVIMSSATYPENCLSFINVYVKCVQHVCPDSNSILVGIKQYVITVTSNSNVVKQTDFKFQELIKILSNHQYKQCLIFCNYMARVVDIHKQLKREMWPAVLLHGQQDQTDRLDTLKALQQYKCRILIATDLAARGIDASNVDLVINFEPPFEWQTYLHRIGRAGRYGSYGMAVTILSEGKEANKFKATLKAMEIPIMLKKLWTGDEFDVKTLDDDTMQYSKDTSTIEEKHIENSTDLWNLLTGKENKNVDSFQSFEVLLNSYSECNGSKIHTFSDFLQSFENEKESPYENEGTISKFITLKEYFNDFKKGSLDIETPLNDKIEVHLKNAVLINNVCQNEKELNNNYFTNGNSYLNSDTTDIKLSGNNYIKNNSNEIEYTERVSFEDSLPKSFVGKNHKKNISKQKKYNKLESAFIENGECYNLGQDEYVNLDNCKSKQKASMNGNTKEYCGNTLLQRNDNKINKETKKVYSTGTNSLECHLLKIPMQNNSTNNFDYNAWYNRLKTHMKYIEYGFYIEEMANLRINNE